MTKQIIVSPLGKIQYVDGTGADIATIKADPDIASAISLKHIQNTDTAIIGYTGDFTNVLSGVIVTADGYYNGYNPTRAVDGNLDFGSGAWFNTVTSGWLKFDLDVTPKILTSFKFYFDILYDGGIGIKDFTIQGSNDDSLWDDLYTGQTVNIVGWQQFNFSNTTSYRYYRINIASVWEPNTNEWVTEVEASESVSISAVSGSNIYEAVSKKHIQNTDSQITDGTNIAKINTVGENAQGKPEIQVPASVKFVDGSFIGSIKRVSEDGGAFGFVDAADSVYQPIKVGDVYTSQVIDQNGANGSTPADIRNTVDLKHSQNTDTKTKCPSAEPLDVTLNNNEMTFWVDEGNALLKFKVKDSGGIVKSGSIAIS